MLADAVDPADTERLIDDPDQLTLGPWRPWKPTHNSAAVSGWWRTNRAGSSAFRRTALLGSLVISSRAIGSRSIVWTCRVRPAGATSAAGDAGTFR
jgi:hypothetical protein